LKKGLVGEKGKKEESLEKKYPIERGTSATGGDTGEF